MKIRDVHKILIKKIKTSTRPSSGAISSFTSTEKDKFEDSLSAYKNKSFRTIGPNPYISNSMGSSIILQKNFGNNNEEEFKSQGKNSRTKENNQEDSFNYFSCKSEENLPMDFFKNTSLHGLKYIGERRQHVLERVFWSVAFITGLVVAFFMIRDVWRKYSNNSVIINFAPYETKIEQIPFPAITICNMNKVSKSKATQFMKDAQGPNSHDKKTKAARENLYYLNHVCSSSKSFTRTFNYAASRGKIDRTSLQKANNHSDEYDGDKEDLWQFFLKASPLCSDMILKCIWQEEIKNCSDLFTEIETDYGKCCTFNMFPLSVLHRLNMTGADEVNATETETIPWKWDGDSLLTKEHKEDYPDFPRRQKIPGKSFGLSILLNPDLNEYFCTTSDSVGFRIVPHLPIDVPLIGDLGSAIKPDSEVFVNIRPEVTIANRDTIGAFSREQRQCYFDEEHRLGYYNYYSSRNCFDECIANLTYQECNCRRHYQPGDQPLCGGPKQFHCASNIKKKFVGNHKMHCKMCMPTCTEIAYHSETTYTSLQNSDLLWTDSKGNVAEWSKKNVSIVHIYFGEGSTNAKLREEMYGTVDLIANFGGLMGLCLGFSGLSLVEVIYFLTLRAWCKARRMNRLNSNSSPKKSKNAVMKRTETLMELLDHEVSPTPTIPCMPVYKSPQDSFEIPCANAVQTFKRRNTTSKVNHMLYTMAFTKEGGTVSHEDFFLKPLTTSNTDTTGIKLY